MQLLRGSDNCRLSDAALGHPRKRSAATTTAAIAMPAVTRRQARRDSSCASAVSKWGFGEQWNGKYG